ncbi:Wzz/FepE/Etk N-terminal domain-containing protein [Crenobacter cavernae]|uniref:Polysaccharide chain length determinant N-terminal domain-containing protein n=1 Tax=Crenobacter cavernae TaxID=2290923 RepID=A0A345Y5Y9_9NEIS|nr:Wzz/FepE/Etk N-terminal domain-containing protein [Crenobacter cavernae]AXK39341.1 hypothetical protein DWG20_07805 [Crenobacter cavernae]
MAANYPPQSKEEELDLADLLILCWRHRYWLVGFPLAAVALAFMVVQILPVRYTASATLLLPSQAAGAAAANVVKSDDVVDKLASNQALMASYGVRGAEDARRAALKGALAVSATRDGMVQVSVDSVDPKAAAGLANAVAEAGREQLLEAGVTPEGKLLRQLEIRRRLTVNKLSQAESALRVSAQDIPEDKRAVLRQEAALLALLETRSSEKDEGNMSSAVLSNTAALQGGGVKEQLWRRLFFYQESLRLLDGDIALIRASLKTDFGVASYATVSSEKSSPKAAKILALSGIAGLFFAFLSVFLKVSWQRLRGELRAKLA